MNLLADFVEDHMRHSHTNRHRPEISGVLRTGDENGANTGRDISFHYTPDEDDSGSDDDVIYWHFIPGFERINYFGGRFDFDNHYVLDELRNVEFNNVQIANWQPVHVDDRFYRCRFQDCEIRSLVSMDSLNHHSDFEFAFYSCDFSGCEIHDAKLIKKSLKKAGNYYLIGNPPVLVGSAAVIDWADVLLCESQKPERQWPL
jgi:hypothetical protein